MVWKNGKKHCKSHICQAAEDMAEKEGKDADSIEKQLPNRDLSKKEWRRMNLVS